MAEQIESCFVQRGITLPAHSDIQKIVTRMRWLAEQLSLQKQPRYSSKRSEMLFRAFQSTIQARDIAHSLSAIDNIPAEKLRQLKDRLDYTESSGTRTAAKDVFFELQIAGRLAHSFPAAITLEEPDVAMHLPEPLGKIGFCCKRPKNASAIASAIGKAVKQIRRHNFPCVLMIGIEEIVQHQQLVFDSGERLHDLYKRRINDLVESQRRAMDSGLKGGAEAVVLGGRYHGIMRTPQPQIGFLYGEQYVGFRGMRVAQRSELKTTIEQLFI